MKAANLGGFFIFYGIHFPYKFHFLKISAAVIITLQKTLNTI